jgi:HPt (histidine-containing phosphotransfer) domain-containing protein
MSHSSHISTPENIKKTMFAKLYEAMGSMAEDFLPELVPLLLADTPGMLNNLNLAIQANNSSQVKELAHTLKGSCASLGIVGLAAICQDIENMGNNEDLALAPSRLKDACAEYEQVKLALSDYV